MIPNNLPAPLGFALETTIAVSLLVALVLLLRKPVANRLGAGAAYALWALPMIRLVLPPLPSGWTFRPNLAVGTNEAVQVIEPAAAGVATVTFGAVEHAAMVAPPAAPIPPVAPDIIAASPFNWALALASVWVLGAALALALTIHRHRRFMAVVDAEVEEAGGKMQMMASDTAAEIGLRRPVRICTSLISSGPMVTGILRPVVLLPTWFEEDYTRDEQRAAIAHELTHVKRRDLWALQFAHIAMALQWFNPLAHYALRAFRSDQEAACDADVLRCTTMSPRDYGATLVKAVRLSQSARPRMLAAGLPLTHAIKDRLVLMQNPAPSFRKKLVGGSLTGVVGAFAIVATASAHGTQKNITISDGQLTIDGKTYEDRRFVLLDEPFGQHDFHFEFDGDFDFAEFGERMAEDGEALAEMLNGMDFSAMIEFDELAELGALGELQVLAELPQLLEGVVPNIDVTTLEDGSTRIVIPRQEINLPSNLAEIEVRAEQLAARAEAIAARAEARAEAMEAQIEARSDHIEAQAERMAQRAEAHAMRVERKMEAKIQPTTEAIDALANACAQRKLDDSEPIVIEHEVEGTKRKLKALCVKGGQGALHTADVETFLKSYPGLTDEQRERFISNRGGEGQSMRFNWELRGGPDSNIETPADLED